MAELDITVVESGGKDNGYNWMSGAIRLGEIDATSVKDMVDKLLKKLKESEDGSCIKSLTIIGHGSPGNISVGDGQGHEKGKHIGINNKDEWKDEIDRLKGKFCKNGEIFLRGCNTGADEAGACLLAELAGCLGVTVKAVTGTCYPLWTEGETQEADSDKKPKAKPIDGVKKKTKKKDKKSKNRFGRGDEKAVELDNALLNKGRSVTSLAFKGPTGFATLDLCDIAALSWLPTNNGDAPEVWIPSQLSTGMAQNIINGIHTDIEPTSFDGLGFDVLGYLYLHPSGQRNSALAGLAPSPVIGNYEWLIPAGDWCRGYQLSEGAAETLRQLSLAPH